MQIPCVDCITKPSCMNEDLGTLMSKCSLLNSALDEANKKRHIFNKFLNEFAEIMYGRNMIRII